MRARLAIACVCLVSCVARTPDPAERVVLGEIDCPPGATVERGRFEEYEQFRCTDAAGRPHGPDLVVDPIRGTPVIAAEYDHGVPHGPMRSWHPNGRLALEWTYEAGQPAGSWRYWHQNGQLAEEIRWSDAETGFARRWNHRGELRWEGVIEVDDYVGEGAGPRPAAD